MEHRNAVIQGFFPGGKPRVPAAQPIQRAATAGTPEWVRARIAFGGAAQPKLTPAVPSRAPQPPPVQRLANGTAFRLPPQFAHVAPGAGQPLPPAVCQRMESFFRTSFSDVRVHVGPHVTELGAVAFTTGHDIHFAPGRYDPATPQGQALLARELTHVVQQRAGRVHNPFTNGTAIVQDAALDAEAERMAQQWSAAQRPQTVQRRVSYDARRGTRVVITRGSDRGDTGRVLRRSTARRNTLVVEFDNDPGAGYRVHIDDMDPEGGRSRSRSRSRSPRRERAERDAPAQAPRNEIRRTGPDADGYYTLTAYSGHAAQGSVKILLTVEGSAELSQLAVDAEYRRHGVGRALMNAAIATARANRQREIWLDAQAQGGVTQSELTAFYQSLGFGFDNSRRERNMSLQLEF